MQHDKTSNEPLTEDRQGEVLLQDTIDPNNTQKKLYLESYGCQMNFSDSEVVASILAQDGYATTRNIAEADLVLINTCSIRDNAEQRVRNRLTEFQHHKQQNPELVVGILGCMAERLKKNLLEEEKLVDIVAGPDAYRDLPNLISEVGTGQKSCKCATLTGGNLCRYFPCSIRSRRDFCLRNHYEGL